MRVTSVATDYDGARSGVKESRDQRTSVVHGGFE
ncbi:hypothetical protein QFZ79_000781 [Arthrobacter sp. V4I6]|nr:hypothetical protein [Arthrobacter sp. V4I6]